MSSRTAFLKPWNMCSSSAWKTLQNCVEAIYWPQVRRFNVTWALTFVYSVRRNTLKFCLLTYVIQAVLTSTLRISTSRHTAVTVLGTTASILKTSCCQLHNPAAFTAIIKMHWKEHWGVFQSCEISVTSMHWIWFSCMYSVCEKFTECRPVVF